MIYLLAAFSCSALVSIVLKISERWEYDKYGMLTINYLACLVPFLLSQTGKEAPVLDSAFTLSIIFAVINGIFYITGMVLNQINVKRNGATLQAAFSRLGVMVPICLSILCFEEIPSAVQTCGIILVLAAFYIMNIRKRDTGEKTRPVFSLLLLGLLTNGIADSMLKVFEVFGERSLDDWFMGFTFLSAALICLIIMLARHERMGKREILTGLCLGIPNYLSSLLLLKSLSQVNAYIDYPTYSVGAILIVMAAGIIFFKERLSKQSIISILMIIPAIILLNI